MTLQPSTASTSVSRVRIDACPAGRARGKPHLARRNEALTCSTRIP